MNKLELPKDLTLKECIEAHHQIQLGPIKQVQSVEPLDSKILTPILQAYKPMQQQRFYPADLVKTFLLIKINSLAKSEANVPTKFIHQLIEHFNKAPLDDFWISQGEHQIFSQIILQIDGQNFLSRKDLDNILDGSALLAAINVWMVFQGRMFFRKQEVAFALSFTALGGRRKAFVEIVHKQKNHKGQAEYAKQIYEYTNIKDISQNGIAELKVQDPYSMRCSPHVHGVAYDSLANLQSSIDSMLNRTHCKYITIGGKTFPNLLQDSDTFSLKLDYVILSMQEIGAMSFLRSERILNSYLGKNKIDQTSPEYISLKALMRSCIKLASRNKILSEMGNFDTMNINNYNEDIFFSSGAYFLKCEELIKNLYNIMTLEILSSIQALRSLYTDKVETIFQHQEFANNFNFLNKNCCAIDKRISVQTIRKSWMAQKQFL